MPRCLSHWSNEETENPLLADDRNLYKLEKWAKDGMRSTAISRREALQHRGKDRSLVPRNASGLYEGTNGLYSTR